MIFFVPAYDDSTISNHNVILDIVPVDGINLLAEAATRESLLDAITKHDMPLFIMSHGKKEAIFYQKNLPALSIEDKELIKYRSIFAFACHTASELGQIVSSNSSVWWGYTGAIAAPSDDSKCLELFQMIFKFIIDTFSEARSLEKISEIVNKIKDLSHEVNIRLDEVDPLGFWDARLCLSNIWERLRVCAFFLDNVYQHPQSKQPIIID